MSYNSFHTELTTNQKRKLIHAKKHGIGAIITITKVGGQDELMLTESQIKKIQKKMPVRISLSPTQMKQQSGGFLGSIIPFLTKTILPALGTLGLSAATGAISGATHKATSGSGLYRTGDGVYPLKMNKDDMHKFLTAVSSFEGSGVLPSGTLNKYMKEIKQQRAGFIGTLLATLAGSVLPALLGGLKN